ncbi:hypothetical protein HOO65_010379 [Ceratocystis lukuohia]|uniref:Cytochrome b561 domain-containing protein n=1 Tax=Ceratocystis lukuohia TaxID=2019550 RepID=A0ABR4MRX0_9PEZI
MPSSGIEQTGNTEAGVPQNEAVPLLGDRGDAAQVIGDSMAHNLVLGTGILAQIANVLFLLTIWATILLGDVILFSGHPLAASVGVFSLIQSILVLQPTHTASQKRTGQRCHAAFNTLTFLGVGVGIGIIEYNKVKNGMPHFHSIHAYFGVVTGVLMAVQLLVGVTMWAVPSLYGGEQQAKSIWKYHRMSGYTLLLLVLATIVSATRTDYIVRVAEIKTWSIVFLCVFIVAGIFPRIQRRKLGI